MVKKFISTIFCVFLFLALMTQGALAVNNVSDINVDVVIYEDGSAYITQTWNCNFNEGTEGYIPIENLNGMSISEFLVSDESGVYTYIEDWDVEAGFDEKAGKYGMVKTNKGYELCWGISEYGEKRYAIEYKINNLVGGYEDFDGFNFQFINSGMGTLPTDVTVKITMHNGIKLDENNGGIWAFGFDGEINFENGNVVAYTKKPLSSGTDSVIIMLQLNKGLINPTRVVNKSFESVKAQAFKGSDYDYGTGTGENSSELPQEAPSFFELVLGMVIAVFPFAIIIYFVRRIRRPKKKIRTLYKNADYFREAPIEGNLEATFVLAKDFDQTKDDGNLIGSAFLMLINAGCLEPMSEKTVGFFGKEKENISLKLMHPPQFTGVTAKMLYDLLVLASGSDQILQENELESYCRKNHKAIMRIIKAAKQEGKNTLIHIDCYDTSKKAKPLGLSQAGENLLLNTMGFKKYLLEFSLIGERSIAESVIWQDYLTFATLLGIADKVIEQFKKVYPDATHYSDKARYHYLLVHRYTKASYHASQTARSSGSGGRSSFGGGGGFSGGGSGGGTR
ncbi:Predicted membrane protein [Natronincola peptidivorans]|uniref:Predicted membrane protein n=1 Tax=Natronincola peptidivorans TaxID=426128 RepID=A0A1I0HCJ2_9FIRM|nr:DUF2207 domain-containing protein [Natronincola peptidivorans]SET81546.1 Predicted membrane protein [Natronincola peptidivorans]